MLELVAEATGYPADMLDPELDLEADLGVDTVKQAETFAAVREEWSIPRQENLKLRDFPTLRHVVGFVRQHRPDLAAAAATSTSTPTPTSTSTSTSTSTAIPRAPDLRVISPATRRVWAPAHPHRPRSSAERPRSRARAVARRSVDFTGRSP